MSAAVLQIVVCAWCERVRIGADRWEPTPSEDRDPDGATHGICPDCLAEEQRAAALAVECR